MKVMMILPALTEATSPFWRPIKYSLFPPLGLATLAAYLNDDDLVDIQDEHVEPLNLEDTPDLVVIQVYITSAHRAYRIADQYRARGVHVALGGLHVTSLPEEASLHADTIFLGPGEDTWPQFLADLADGRARRVYQSTLRTLAGLPPIRRDLIKRRLYLVPNSIVVSRGCPHVCDFCYKEAFFEGGRSFYTQTVDAALAEIERLPGRHLYFLDDHLFGDRRFASALFSGMRGMGRLWQAAGTVNAVLTPGLLEQAVEAGLRSLFVGFETLNPVNLAEQHKYQNMRRDYGAAIRRLHDLGVMINGSFVFGMDGDDRSVFGRTVDWAITHGIETATFHVLTPYPGTALYRRLADQQRLVVHDWDRYDTRHAVFTPARMTGPQLEDGYHWAYREFYRWRSLARGAAAHGELTAGLRHFAYAAGWKKFEPLWDVVIRARRAGAMLPVLETILSEFGRRAPDRQGRAAARGSVPGTATSAGNHPLTVADSAAS
ncbi:MAG: B12-binding domain-containing radical SAM protein [Acidobacteria bacterium]|nr:B12-binding domain-containing radical SAM protein [Acidobacteriota bacterium]